ncbi:putative 6-aminohexanoate-cyclic-dimer hydrolase [Hyphomonas neptunium ATCC 15444]|uniref:Putative 6-aminohexanoate-cyclic-dimer hydrolase n=2 Tax=Hyphomonas TaxID=85 RepID=Q0C1T3_HYPNA|nr:MULTISPECIES: amidase family protein [Hyphomonas]ABI76665.1 putative 6-aminohexanoate-cyclic-dimer hydrolase [Hyphomonas neptunium ATCC 15444]KCZ92604.1 putative 6-aminohexanoate-cyclic-dimer hydrolase [Hyphomonas hirschiana VP5]
MQLSDYSEYDALALAELVRSRQVTALELVDAAIERIERHNPALNAVVHNAFEEARQTAKGALPDGPFKGVPFLIKDLGQRVSGWPRTSASVYAEVKADRDDSELVRRYRAAGLVLAGKTNTPEFGIPGVTQSERLGACRNPWNPDHISGGSSGGAAAAVASGMVPVAHASDGLGSIRIPAACCGLVGMKPTRDRNPNGGEDSDRAIGFSVDHVVSRTVRDSAAMLDATGYPEPASPYAYPKKERPYLEEVGRAPGRLKIFWSAQTPSGRPVAPEMAAATERTAEHLAKLGHDVREQAITLDWRTFYRAQAVVSGSNFAAGMARMVQEIGREPGSDIGPLARRGYDRGREITGQQAMWGWQQLRLMGRMVLAVFEECDVYLSPVLGTEPPKVDWLDPLSLDIKEYDKRSAATFPFTPAFNITGQPSLSLPLWQSDNNLPLAMMFTGRYGDEGTLYRLAGQLEKELPWKDRRPPIWN